MFFHVNTRNGRVVLTCSSVKHSFNSAETVLGHVKHHRKDWFDDNDTEIRELLDHIYELKTP